MRCSISDILRASQCVYNWLGYLSKASDNSKLIAESSLKYPFVECLERHSINGIHLELSHPLFKGKRIDAYIGSIHDDGTIDEQSTRKIFVEFKFVRGDTLSKKEQQRYFNDILRLSYLKQKYPQSDSYLLVCGESDSFNVAFRYEPIISVDKKIKEDGNDERRMKKKSIYNDWLGFEMKYGEKSVDITKRKYESFVKSFNEKYLSRKRDGVLAVEKEIQTFSTKLNLMLPSSSSIDNSYSLGLWEIL